MSRIYRLTCGHYTDYAVMVLYECFRPYKTQTFCERCEDWREVKPPAPKPEIPAEPLF